MISVLNDVLYKDSVCVWDDVWWKINYVEKSIVNYIVIIGDQLVASRWKLVASYIYFLVLVIVYLQISIDGSSQMIDLPLEILVLDYKY